MQNDKFAPPPLGMQNDKYPPPMGFVSAPPQQGYPPQGHPQPGYPTYITPADTYGGAPPPPPQPPRDPPTRVDPPREGCFQRNQKNKPQPNAVGSGEFCFRIH